MSRPSLTSALAWRTGELRRLADGWDEAARVIHQRATAASRAGQDTGRVWTGVAAEAAQNDARTFTAEGDAVARTLVLAAVAARDGADQLAKRQAELAAHVEKARSEGFLIGDDGSAAPETLPSALLIMLSGNDAGVAAQMLAARGTELSRQIVRALDDVGAADEDAAHDVREALESVDLVADTAMGNTDGVPWEVRIAANRTNVAQAIVDALDDGGDRRNAFYRGLLGEIDDPGGSGRRIDRKILAFDPASESLVELNGDLAVANSVAVLVPGMNTTIDGSADNTRSARQFVSATRGAVAAITYLGGPFPQDETVTGALLEAASPRFAINMAPRLVAFSRDVEATVDATGRAIPVTYVGHSYGGAILGTAEALGMTADRTLYAAAAGAGFGVDGPEDWHNRNPHVLRFSMTAPMDPIQLVQGIPGGPHGADPDEMPGVIHLATGRYDDGRPVAGPRAHTDVLSVAGSDAWRNVLAVIVGDREHIVLAG
ncbi:alpha/beta hydrolase [Mycolicibacterium hodleri]|uniref:Alpha/beta hydrolase n=1 Tax=Mycolicibacterium hodleri TaxID=49897 RepID=A0A502E917_9MYCO|nr:alpha/beta hydrolase [Mycolicibacterium hodleri]TPG33489.1 alpha/beta hydrolase [Mycolicibacterium hodleri]